MNWLIIPLIIFFLIPSTGDVTSFLEADKTNEISYIHQVDDYFVEGDFVCHDYAETLYYNAREEGLIIGYVSVKFESGYHALNVFLTKEGLVFVDCSTGHDAIVNLEVNKPYSYTYSDGFGSYAAIGSLVIDYEIFWDINLR
jgi:hypothetical protein